MVTNGHQEMSTMLVDHMKHKQEERKKKHIVTKEVKISVVGSTLTHEIKKSSHVNIAKFRHIRME